MKLGSSISYHRTVENISRSSWNSDDSEAWFHGLAEVKANTVLSQTLKSLFLSVDENQVHDIYSVLVTDLQSGSISSGA